MPMFGPRKRADRRLVLARCREAVREISTAEARAADAALLLLGHQIEITAPRRPRSLDDAVGDGGDGGVNAMAAPYSCQLMPSRSVSAIAADGPHVPAA